jgi:hypothetical protein
LSGRARQASQDTKAPGTKWLTVKEWSGGVTIEHSLKERFERPAGPWRLSYHTDAGDAARSAVVDVLVWTKDNQLAAAAYNLQGTTSGTLTIKREQPEYFVEVKSFGPRWRIAIERSE